LFTHEIARRLVRRNHRIILFTANYTGGMTREILDGVEIIREGGKYSVYKYAKNYVLREKERFDIIIDEINTRPFMTPNYVKSVPILAIIHQLAREFWFYETPFPVNYIGFYILEKRWLKPYRNVKTVTVSDSTREDLVNLGFQDIHIVPEGLSTDPLEKLKEKESIPTLVFMGRLKKAKLPTHAIKAFDVIKKKFSEAQLWVIGDGYMRRRLEKSKPSGVKFLGFIDNTRKYELLSKAHLLLVPAVREGWGLVVTEANAMGTPAVAYNVPGLRDSVLDGVTGALTENNTPEEMGKRATSLLRDKALLDQYSKNALDNSRQYNWDHSTDIFESTIRDTCCPPRDK